MACPEIGLPPVNPDVKDSNSNSDVAKDEAEKHDDSRSSVAPEEERNNESNGVIVWHYLEFETELPSPNLARSRRAPNEQTPPECPNLKKYTSPFLWSKTRKNFMILLSCLVTIIAAYNAGAYSPGVQQMSEEWSKGRVAVLVGITTFTAGFGIAPMFLAPFSELNGRRPVFVASGIVSIQSSWLGTPFRYANSLAAVCHIPSRLCCYTYLCRNDRDTILDWLHEQYVQHHGRRSCE